jgi:serine protease Do
MRDVNFEGDLKSIFGTELATVSPTQRIVHMCSDQPVARRLAGVAVVLVLLSACSLQSSSAATGPAAPAKPAAGPTATPDAAASRDVPAAVNARGLPDFSGLVERYGPAVVNVQVVEKLQTVEESGPNGLSPNDPFQDFFRRFGIPAPGQGPHGFGQGVPQRGEGSGFIVSPDGYILTNAHVVADASAVTVKLTDRREYIAKVIGVDRATDVAVIKIDAKDLPVVKIGDPTKLKPGQWVLAIGSPFGLENTATAGIVSATARALPQDNYVPFIQTDVAVNPGNSGGPLFNLNGEVVGINSQIYSRTGGYMGLSFAIPIDVAVNVEGQLIKTGRVSRGRIGVAIQEVNAQLAESFGLDRPRGALVSTVENGGPAEAGGVKPGDVILKVDGKPIERSSDVPSLIAAVHPGSTTQLEVWRDHAAKSLNVRVIALQEQGEKVALRTDGAGQPSESSRLGLTLRQLQPEEKKEAQTEGSILVEDVNGAAALAGVQSGDLILGVNGSRVETLAGLNAAAKKSGKTVALLIQRDNAQIFVPVRLS